jgi:uncharacterized protein (DUF433 family)
MPTTHPLITIDPARRGGRPCIRSLRITVGDVLGWLAQGMAQADILADYPELTQADIQACLAYAAERELHEVRIAAAA